MCLSHSNAAISEEENGVGSASEELDKFLSEQNLPRMTGLMCGVKTQTQIFSGGEFTKRRADLGYRDAQLHTGYRLLNGIDLPRNIDLGREYLHKAAEQGMTEAHYILGDSLLNEGLTDETAPVAEEHFRIAMNAGCNEALVGLARTATFHEQHNQATTYLEAARDGGSYRAEVRLTEEKLSYECDDQEAMAPVMEKLGRLMRPPRNPLFPNGSIFAGISFVIFWSELAKQCDLPSDPRFAMFGMYVVSRASMQSAHGLQRATVALANAFNGEFFRTQHKQMSFRSYRRAACLYLPLGMQRFAESLVTGLGSEVDKNRALSWYLFLAEDRYATDEFRQTAKEAINELKGDIDGARLHWTREQVRVDLFSQCGTESWPQKPRVVPKSDKKPD